MNTSVSLLLICIWIGLPVSAAIRSPLLQLGRQASLYFGPYYLNCSSTDFRDFSHFRIEEGNAFEQPIAGDYVKVGGAVHIKTNQTYRFINAKMVRGRGGFDTLLFSTEKVDGVEYRFQGTFLKKPELVRATGNYTDLRGVLLMKKNGKKIAEERLDFFVWIEE